MKRFNIDFILFNMNTKQKEVNLLNIQMWTTIIYIGSLFISISLTYNDKQNLLNKKGFYNENQSQKLSIGNRWLVLFLTFSYLFINYKNINLAKEKGQKLWPFYLQVFSSELSTLAAIIVLYVVIKTAGEQYSIVSGIENPTL